MFPAHYHRALGDLGRLIYNWFKKNEPIEDTPPEQPPVEHWHEMPRMYSGYRGMPRMYKDFKGR